MAKNLLQKLNTLIQASLHEAVNIKLPRPLGKNIDQQMAALRQQIALAEEDEQAIIRRKETLSAEILRWDEQADQAVAAGQDAQARYAIQQMETAKRRLTMLESELDDHRRAISDLMQQVNHLEAVIEVARREAAAASEQTTVEEERSLAQSIQQAREAIQPQAKAVRLEINETEPIEQASDAIEADLAARRSRLAKPD